MTDIKKLKQVHLKLIEQAEFYNGDYGKLLFSDDFIECFDGVLTAKKVKDYVSIVKTYNNLKRAYFDLALKLKDYHVEIKNDRILSPAQKLKMIEKIQKTGEKEFNRINNKLDEYHLKTEEVFEVFNALYHELIKHYPEIDYAIAFNSNKKRKGFRAITNQLNGMSLKIIVNYYDDAQTILGDLTVKNNLSDFTKLLELGSYVYRIADEFNGIVYNANDESIYNAKEKERRIARIKYIHGNNYEEKKYNYVLDKLEEEHEKYLNEYNLLNSESEMKSKVDDYVKSVDGVVLSTLKNIINK